MILAYSKGSDIVSNSVMRNKYWELYDTERIMKQLDALNATIGNKTLVFIDVGANIGWFTLAAASKGYKVQAFEPFSTNIFGLNFSLCLNPKYDQLVTINKVALGSKNASCALFSENNNQENGQIECGEGDRPHAIFRENITVTTLDSFVGTFPENYYLGVMKIDIEGYQYYMFQGSKQFFSKYQVPYILMEWAPGYMKDLNYTEQMMFDIIHEVGYDIRLKSFDGEIIANYKTPQGLPYIRDYENIYMTRRI